MFGNLQSNDISRRQIWNLFPTATTSEEQIHCTPFTLPSNGTIELNNSTTITLTADAVFQAACTSISKVVDLSAAQSVVDNRDPFYASESPQIYTLAATTIVAYTLVIMLFITPRAFFFGGSGRGPFFGEGIIGGSYGSSVIGLGGRPWLQKVAALTVAISLTIASVDTFDVAEQQYDMGYVDATLLTNSVVAGVELRVIRVISGTFLWLAQVQTLVRLFPRHKEKVVIKWAGFALIILDTVFSILNNFYTHTEKLRPRSFVDAIPALSYLFELSLSLLYAAWVIYYSISKRRFAFFHPKMQNICLVAILSLTALLIPVVFFILDIAKPNVSGWGDYIRWVGAAAASVIVWEWVERIEMLERDERKDGILGREVYDGDELSDLPPSQEVDWPAQPRTPLARNFGNNANGGEDGHLRSRNAHTRYRLPKYHAAVRSRPNGPCPRQEQTHVSLSNSVPGTQLHCTSLPSQPPVAVSPVSRADTTSAGSTVYDVHYHPIIEPTPPIPETRDVQHANMHDSPIADHNGLLPSPANGNGNPEPTNADIHNAHTRPTPRKKMWYSMSNPLKRRRLSPPLEVAVAQGAGGNVTDVQNAAKEPENKGRQLRSRLGKMAAKGKASFRKRNTNTDIEFLPITIIPAPPRGQGAWVPSDSSSLKPGSSDCGAEATTFHEDEQMRTASASVQHLSTMSLQLGDATSTATPTAPVIDNHNSPLGSSQMQPPTHEHTERQRHSERVLAMNGSQVQEPDLRGEFLAESITNDDAPVPTGALHHRSLVQNETGGIGGRQLRDHGALGPKDEPDDRDTR